jgi:ABC-type nitrate/sulfonate/bicarbonate transport system permease component
VGLAAVGGLLAVWWIAAALVLPLLGPEGPRLLPSPGLVAARGWELLVEGKIFLHATATLRRVAVAFAIVLATAIPLGILSGTSETVRCLVEPITELLRPIPPIAWIPLSILWFGIDDAQKVYIIGFAAFFPLLINTAVGVRQVNRVLLGAALTLGSSRRQLLWHVVLPAATPYVFAGVRIAFGIGWMALVGAEVAVAVAGLGHLIMASRQGFDSAAVIVGMIVIGILGFSFEVGLRRLHRRVAPWHPEFQEGR